MSILRHPLAPWLLVALALACARNPTGGTDLVMMSEEDEIALGHASVEQLRGQFPAYKNRELQARVERIGAELAALSHRPDIAYDFTLVDTPDVNAFALPGGHIYVTRGLLAYLESDAELAGVLGHEIGHVAARHSVQRHSQQRLTQAGVYLGSLAASAFGDAYAGAAAADLGNLFGGALLSGYGREDELQADRLGAEYMAKAGYDPEALLDVITTLKDQEIFEIDRAAEEGRRANVYHGVFASHPSADQRLKEIIESVAGTESDERRPEDREAFLLSLDGMAFGPSWAHGVIRGRNFYLGYVGMGLTFPRDWAIQNEPSRVLAIAPGNEAVLQLTLADRGRNKTPRDFFRWEMRMSNETHAAEFTLSGLPAFTAVAKTDTPYGNRETRFSVVFMGSQVYVFQGAGRDHAHGLDQFDRDFLDTAGSLRPLSEREQAATRGPVIRVRRATEGTTYEALSRSTRIKSYQEQTLRLLNHQYPEGEPEAGSLIKLVK